MSTPDLGDSSRHSPDTGTQDRSRIETPASTQHVEALAASNGLAGIPTVVNSLAELIRSLEIVGPLLQDGIVCRSADLHVVYVSPSVLLSSGLTLEEFIAAQPQDIADAADAEELARLFRTGEYSLDESAVTNPQALAKVRVASVQQPDGEMMYAEFSVTPVVNTAAELVAIITYARDVTHRVQHKDLEQVSATAIRQLLDLVPIGVVVRDPSGVIIFANRAAESVAGCEPGWLIGRTVFEIVHPDDEEFLRQRVNRPKRPKTSAGGEYRIRTQDGVTKWIRTATSVVTWNGKDAVMFSVQDISRAKEEIIRAASDLHDQVLQPTVASNMRLSLSVGELGGDVDLNSAWIARSIIGDVVGNVSGLLSRLESTLTSRSGADPTWT